MKFAIDISSTPINQTYSTTHHFSAKELEPLQCSHGLGRSLDISENDMCLTAHLLCPQSNNIEDRAIGGEENIERDSQVGLLNLRRRKIIDIESLVWREGGDAAGLARTRSLFLWEKSVRACARTSEFLKELRCKITLSPGHSFGKKTHLQNRNAHGIPRPTTSS